MKTKAKIIFKSLADLPADAVAFVAAVPERALEVTKQVFVPTAKAAAFDHKVTGRDALEFAPAHAVSRAPLQHPWPRGGLNE